MADGADSAGPSVVVAGWAGAGNIGDELLTSWIVGRLRLLGASATVVSSDPDATRVLHGVEAVPVASWRVMDAIRRADGLCFGPGGLVQDSSSPWSLPLHLSRPITARLTGTPWIGVGLGVDAFVRPGSSAMARLALTNAVALTVRDRESAAVLEALGIEVDVAPDVVFGLAADRLAERSGPVDVGGDRVVVAVGPEVGEGRMSDRADQRLSFTDVEAVADAVSELAGSLGAPVELVAFRGERDTLFADLVSKRVGSAAVVRDVTAIDALDVVADARAVVTSRLHAAVLAVACGTPCVVWPRAAKLESLLFEHRELVRSSHPSDWREAVESQALGPSTNRWGVHGGDRALLRAHESAVEALMARIG